MCSSDLLWRAWACACGTFLFKDHVPQAQAHALHSGADKRFDSLGGISARLLRHKNLQTNKKRGPCGPRFSKSYIVLLEYSILPVIMQGVLRKNLSDTPTGVPPSPIRGAGTKHLRGSYSTQTPFRNSSTTRPSRHLPVIWLSSAPIITSSWMVDWFMPRSSSCSLVRPVPPSVVPG